YYFIVRFISILYTSVMYYVHNSLLHTIPTRRSSDLLFAVAFGSADKPVCRIADCDTCENPCHHQRPVEMMLPEDVLGSIITTGLDRKSTRLNSSHLGISYAVFCL